jgi:glycosyltransferase involved in cell wall biosynthesis
VLDEERSVMVQEACSDSRPTAALILPCRNEEDVIVQRVERLLDVVAEGMETVDVQSLIVVDHGSADDTALLANRAGAQVIVTSQRGFGGACLTGLQAVPDVDIVVMLDGEGADELTDLDRFVAPVAEGDADLVVGAQADHKRNPMITALFDLLYGERIARVGPMQVIRRPVLESLDMRETSGGWAIEMIGKVVRRGLRVEYVTLRPGRDVALRARRSPDRSLQRIAAFLRSRRSGLPRAS